MTHITLKIVILCVICAATMMSGCIDPATEESPIEQDIPNGSSGGDYRNDSYRNDSITDMGARITEKARVTGLSSLETQDLALPDDIPSATPTPSYTPATALSSSIPDDYYNVTIDQYFVDNKLYKYLDGYTWNKPLVRGAGWGLPEVTELERDLTNKGCNVSIRYASVSTTIDHEEFKNRVKTDGYARSACLPEMDQYDYWLMIEFEGEVVAYDVYWSCWVFKPDHKSKNWYTSNGRWHSWYYYQEGHTEIYDGNTWTVYDFEDFDNIYDLEEWFLSSDAVTHVAENCKNGVWCSYFASEDYNATDHFMIQFGWWMTDNEYHETETRINTATDWFVLVD